MRLSKLAILTALVYTVLIGSSLLSYRVFLVYPELKTATLDLHSRNLQSTNSTLQEKISELSNHNLKWAKWDETYGFLVADDPDYISRNILRPSFLQYNIDAVAIIKSNGSLKYGSKKDKDNFVPVKALKDISNDFNINALISSDNQKGFVTINGDLAYFSSHQIQDSESNYKPRGAIVFIRIIKHDFFSQIKLLTDMNLKIKSPEYITSFTPGSALLTFTDDKITDLHSTYLIPLNSHQGNPIAIMSLSGDPDKIPSMLDTTTIITIIALALLPIILTTVIWSVFLIPITQIFDQIRRMEKTGSISFIEHHSHVLEIDRFTSKFNALVDKIHSYQKDLKNESLTDGLTGIPNRRHFDMKYDEAWRFCVRNNLTICIIMIDIDNFKNYNDHYGHQAGDDALIKVANELNKFVRRSTDLLARYGGEEFIAILKTNNKKELTNVLSNIRTSIKQLDIQHDYSGNDKHITVSCGACLIESPGIWVKDLKQAAIKLADQALYQAKENGRDTFTINHLTQNDCELHRNTLSGAD
jgi:diguanylate cyclase (GGDEF)-like protein